MKFENCPHCGGRIRSESIGWKCERCRGFIDMQGNFHEHVERPFMSPMTNADRIRAMSDEEFGNWICDLFDAHGCVKSCPGVELCNGKDGKSNGIKKWLQQPAEGE